MTDEFGFSCVTICKTPTEGIAEYGDGSVILCTDSYTIYDDIEDKEGVDGLAVTHY